MPIIATDLRNTRDGARQLRYEPTPPFSATNVQDAIGQAYTLPASITPTTVTVAMSPYTVQSTDTLLLVNTSAGAVTINLQAASARAGAPIIIKDDTGNAATNAITVVPNGAETIDSLASYPMDSNYVATQFMPQTGGYFVAP